VLKRQKIVTPIISNFYDSKKKKNFSSDKIFSAIMTLQKIELQPVSIRELVSCESVSKTLLFA